MDIKNCIERVLPPLRRGRNSRWKLGVAYFVLIIAFALLYGIFGNIGENVDYFNYLYFSVVTITSLGYGDFGPLDLFTKILVMIQILLGIVIFGLFISAVADADRKSEQLEVKLDKLDKLLPFVRIGIEEVLQNFSYKGIRSIEDLELHRDHAEFYEDAWLFVRESVNRLVDTSIKYHDDLQDSGDLAIDSYLQYADLLMASVQFTNSLSDDGQACPPPMLFEIYGHVIRLNRAE